MGDPVISYESAQTAFPFEEMTNSGDNQNFSASFSPISAAQDDLKVCPYGLKTGGVITPGSSNDEVDVAALTVVAPGMTGANADGEVTVSAGTVSISRGLTTDTHRITSITVDSSGSLAAVAGVDNTSFSDIRGADGGPPLIPVGSIEIGQVRTTSVAAAAVAQSEIFQVVGQHQERSDFPIWTVDFANGEVDFVDSLPTIHTGNVTKKVYIKGSTPVFAKIPRTSDWAPADATFTITSTETYDGPIGSPSSSLGQATFNAVLTDGISDAFLAQRGKTIWFEFRPDRDKSLPKQLTQGLFATGRTFPAGGGSFTAACTITPQEATTDVTA
jgi:hypothetical protein